LERLAHGGYAEVLTPAAVKRRRNQFVRWRDGLSLKYMALTPGEQRRKVRFRRGFGRRRLEQSPERGALILIELG
jgi:hypothetical protein